ncbi:transporter [Nitrincola sp. A-D6]|uniref:AEC family transporter n=1 Tax=Nitrincola sp. A-D6 TaxID=1545442 RepID=UPI00051FA7D5|nr:AEC family transporter [Nitrincola sp. A-D6]KGK40985.1 transporter [Nitrincola sp. A-D6]
MLSVVTVLWPVFALLLTGAGMRRFGFPGDGFWLPAERLTYYFLFPALLIHSLSQASLSGQESLVLMLAVLLLLSAGTLVCYALRRFLQLESAAFTSFYQGSMRFNTFVALAVSSAQFGSAGIALAAVVAAVMIPVLNLLCVLVFAHNADRQPTFGGVLKTLLTNPLILASVLGVIINLAGGLPEMMRPFFVLLSQMALPLGLLSVGAALNLSALRRSGRGMLFAIVIKLLIFPLFAALIALLLGLSTLAAGVFITFATIPTATSAYILARQLGGDASLMAAIITAQTLLSMLTIPFWLMLLL